jgi:hypothetical protein
MGITRVHGTTDKHTRVFSVPSYPPSHRKPDVDSPEHPILISGITQKPTWLKRTLNHVYIY